MQKDNKFVTPEVNLLPQDDLEQRSGGKFLKWSLSWGKKIVILTELLVVIAFLSRFKLDSDVANYSEEIDRRKVIILASEGFEKQFLGVQNRINKVKKINDTSDAVMIYDLVQSLIPPEVAISQVTVSDQKIALEGSGEDQFLSSMVQSFKTSPEISEVNLDKVLKQGQDAGIDFSLTAIYKKRKA